MSTKTTFKRIALVTVAALGFGLLTVTPSTATTQTDTLALASSTTTVLASGIGVATTNTLTQSFLGVGGDTMSVTASLTSAPTLNVAMPVITNSLPGNTTVINAPTITGDGLTAIMSDTGSATVYHRATATYTVTFTPQYAGTYVLTFTPYNHNATLTTAGRTAVAPTATAVTWTITVAGGTVADSTSTSILSAAATAAAAADVVVRVAAGSSAAESARITVTPLTANATTGVGAASTGSTQGSATISGPGTITIGTSSTAPGSGGLKSVQYIPTAYAGVLYVHVYGDGTAGTATITITIGGATKTETVYFYGAAASVTTATIDSVIDSGSGASSTPILTATVKDANGNLVVGATVYAVSATTTVFASTSGTTGTSGTVDLSVLGLIEGTSSVTVQNVATGSTATFSAAAVSIRAGDNVAKSVTMTANQASYTPGEAMIVTVTIKDAAGNLVANGTHTAFAAAVTSSRALSTISNAGDGMLPTASIVTTGSSGPIGSSVTAKHAGYGVVTYAVNAPSTSGAFTLSALGGSGLAAAQAGIAISLTLTVGKSADDIAVDAAIAAAIAAGVAATAAAEAATDAATEAIDAANAATDSANAAAEAADAATAAAQQAGEDAVAAAEAAQAAAVDAAAEATEAANAATDAANAAAESADAATAAAQDASDAVAALSTQVATLISGLKAQLTALTNLVIKIQKKVKA